MSCGKPHETDCDEVLAAVYLYLDDECDETRRGVIKRHLDECAQCLRRFGIEHDVIKLIAHKCGGDRAPAWLRDRIRARIDAAALESAEPDPLID